MTRYAAMFGVLVWAMLVSSAQAVGLGDITLRSALTEPLNAEIRILNPEDLSPAELNVSLASGADFRRAGVERPFFLTALDFTVRLDGDALVVDVTSEEAVQEPFLDFLVELRWPSGRLIREYTLLLDPPIFAPSDGGMDQVFPGADPFDSETSSQSERASPSQDTSVPTAGRIDQLAENQYRVENNDTLWEIALSARQNPAQTPQQVMLAIQDLNPDAFINSNINRIKAGRLLTLPSADQVAVRSAAEATQDVARQNGGLRGTPPAADTQLSASDETATGLSGAAEARDPDGFLEVVTDSAEESEETGAVTGDTNEVARLQNELAIQQELNDELRRQYDDQQTRLNDLEEQVQLLTRLVDLQSESAAQLQAVADELARREAAGTTAEAESGAVEQAAPPPSEDTPTEEPVVDTAVVPAVPMAPNLEAMTQPQVPALVSRLLAWVSQPYNAALVLLALVLLLALTNLTLKRRSAAAEENALELDDDLLVEDTEELAEVDSEWSSASETI
ncbi:MAG: FimV/HubP family polar landmark protein, partial [Natronospirillum sp.]